MKKSVLNVTMQCGFTGRDDPTPPDAESLAAGRGENGMDGPQNNDHRPQRVLQSGLTMEL